MNPSWKEFTPENFFPWPNENFILSTPDWWRGCSTVLKAMSSSSSSSSSSDEYEAENRRLEAETRDLKDALEDAEDVAESLREELDKAKAELDELRQERDDLMDDAENMTGQILTKTTEVTRLQEMGSRLKRMRAECEEEAEELEQEAETARIDLQKALAEVANLKQKLAKKRLSKADIFDAFTMATRRVEELDRHNKELEDRERQRDPTYKRGKLLREVCNPPRSATVVGPTECYIDKLCTAIVFEMTESCCKPRGPLRLSVSRAVDNMFLAKVLLHLNTLKPDMVMQFSASRQIWRDCVMKGPSCNGANDFVSVVPLLRMRDEDAGIVLDVFVTQLRFRDFDDEEDFFVLLEQMTEGTNMNSDGDEDGIDPAAAQ